jgi:hypothetical protein
MKKSISLILAVIAAVLFASSSQSLAYTVVGDVANPGNYSIGGDLWTGVLSSASINVYKGTLNPTGENWIEGDYVLVTGSGGSTALYSVGELNPSYGNQAVSLTANGSGGFDLSGAGRSVNNVTSIDVVHAVDVIKGGTYSFSTQATVSAPGVASKSYDLSSLQAMAQTTYNGSTTSYTGPTLLDVLNDTGVDTANMSQYIIAMGTDGYATVLSMYEVAHPTGTVADLLGIIASNGSINQGQWTNSKGTQNDNGFARLILPGDKGGGRMVSNLANIEVAPVPIPASLFLFGPGIAGLAVLRRRFRMQA